MSLEQRMLETGRRLGHIPKAGHDEITIRDFFAAQYMAAAMERAGSCKEYELRAMFGDRGGIRREEIAAKLAYQFADAMIDAR